MAVLSLRYQCWTSRRPRTDRSAGAAAVCRVRIVAAEPGHGPGQAFLVVAFGAEVEQLVGGVEGVEAAGIGRIRVEHVAVPQGEGADAGRLLGRLVHRDVVV